MLRAAIGVLSPQNAVGSSGVTAFGVWEPKTASWIQQSSHSPPRREMGQAVSQEPEAPFQVKIDPLLKNGDVHGVSVF